MSSGNSSKTLPSTGGGRAAKQSKPSKIIRLQLSTSVLSRFPHDQPTTKTVQVKSSSSTASTQPVNTVPASLPVVKSESNGTPLPKPADSLKVPQEESKRRGVPGPKPGNKRGIAQVSDGTPKPRGKPGPKKKMKLENGVADSSDPTNKSNANPAPAATHKLGPKANQGAINAGLRALDRTGKPCRKWEKKGLRLKSFTGITWQLHSWRTPNKNKADANGEIGAESTPTSNSQSKANNSSSNVESEKSNTQDVELSNATSSPAPLIATPA
ncbi:hypothetical protein MMC20_005224 [Loxospora ochrophaea]|nr:hypothetical protein [Loxospora ochrophaea]